MEKKTITIRKKDIIIIKKKKMNGSKWIPILLLRLHTTVITITIKNLKQRKPSKEF